jgi:hypothetical protein
MKTKDIMRMQAQTSELSLQYAPMLEQMGVQQGTVGYNRLMYNIIEAHEMSPMVGRAFAAKLPEIKDLSIEGIAKARADSFQDDDGEWRFDTSVAKDYGELLADQRRRASGWDFKGALG